MHKVVDTNVLIVASLVDIETDERASKEHPIEERFQTKVHDWLEDFMEADDPVCLDSAGAIAKEYRNNLTEQDFAFFLVDRKWNNAQVEFFDINFDTHGNAILEAELNKIIHDLSDRKFVAVAQAAKTEHNECVIVNATDTDWHDWERDLRKKGFNIEFLIPEYSVDVWKKEKDEFIKFPHTPHIKWLSNKPVRDDKIKSIQEVNFLFSGKVDIEEKIDGTNIGISFDNNAEIRVQRRGSYIRDLHKGEFLQLTTWLDQRINIIFDNLSIRYVLFGEWCKLTHSVYYDKLPDYFIGFDLFDKKDCYFLPPLKRDKMLERMNIVKPHRFFRGLCSLSYAEELLENQFSHYRSKGKPEGLYIRRWSNEKILARGKIVDPDFVDNIETHWRSKETVANRIVS